MEQWALSVRVSSSFPMFCKIFSARQRSQNHNILHIMVKNMLIVNLFYEVYINLQNKITNLELLKHNGPVTSIAHTHNRTLLHSAYKTGTTSSIFIISYAKEGLWYPKWVNFFFFVFFICDNILYNLPLKIRRLYHILPARDAW